MYGTSDEAQQAEQADIGVGGETENIQSESPRTLSGDQGG
jgi:hypothetical protein